MWISYDAIGCRNHADLDVEALRDQLGADYPIADYGARPVQQVRRQVAADQRAASRRSTPEGMR
jgi:hypothetical protein